jgi:hypothetical protein
MKFTTPLLLAFAALTLGNPIVDRNASPVADLVAAPTKTVGAVAGPTTCDQCGDFFKKCKSVSLSPLFHHVLV